MFRNGSSIVVGLLVKNIRRFLAGEPLDASTTAMPTASSRPAFQNAMLLDFNYDVEPLPGHFPGPVGLPLLKETHLSHLGKLMFEWFYWHSLLPGRDILGVHRAMRLAGKVRVTETKEKETPS
jgi:sulfide:quinone oxidoreductase